jgi:hypothetical protein
VIEIDSERLGCDDNPEALERYHRNIPLTAALDPLLRSRKCCAHHDFGTAVNYVLMLRRSAALVRQ